MPPFARRLLAWLLGDYSVYRILSSEGAPQGVPASPAGLQLAVVEAADLASSGEALIREQAWYGGSESRIYACRLDDQIVACCIYWYGARYRTRNFWPLRHNQAKLVQIITLPSQRGRGLARLLIAFSGNDMRSRGFDSLFARVWHSNRPSLSAFEASGWRRVATVVEAYPLGLGRKWRWVIGARPAEPEA